jgi:hypothetical protein
MALKVERVDVWAASIKDEPGGLAEKLAPLAEAGADLEFIIARRKRDQPGFGDVFLTPLRGRAQIAAAKKAGFAAAKGLHSLRIEGANKPGVGAELTAKLANAGINLRGLSAAVIRGQYLLYLGLDTAADATKAMKLLKG